MHDNCLFSIIVLRYDYTGGFQDNYLINKLIKNRWKIVWTYRTYLKVIFSASLRILNIIFRRKVHSKSLKGRWLNRLKFRSKEDNVRNTQYQWITSKSTIDGYMTPNTLKFKALKVSYWPSYIRDIMILPLSSLC